MIVRGGTSWAPRKLARTTPALELDSQTHSWCFSFRLIVNCTDGFIYLFIYLFIYFKFSHSFLIGSTRLVVFMNGFWKFT